MFGRSLATAGLGADWRGPFKVLASGGYAVGAFIIVRGFVIFYLLDAERESYGRFIWRRFLRLYPAYFVCLLTAALLLNTTATVFANAPWPHPLNASRIKIAQDSLAFLPRQMAAHLVMAQSLVPDWILPSSNYGVLGQAWSLSLEWQFYLIAPFLLSALAKGPGPRLPRPASPARRIFFSQERRGSFQCTYRCSRSASCPITHGVRLGARIRPANRFIENAGTVAPNVR